MQWLDDLMKLNSLLLTFFGLGIVGLLSKIFQFTNKIYKDKKKANKEQTEFLNELKESDKKQTNRLKQLEAYQDNLMKAQKATLHNQIWNKADEYLKRGWITVGELDNFDHLYYAYKGVEGNHTGDTLHKKVKRLEIKDEGILKGNEI